MSNIIVVGVDGSQTAQNAAHAAAELAANHTERPSTSGVPMNAQTMKSWAKSAAEGWSPAATDAEGIAGAVTAGMRKVVSTITSGAGPGRAC